jgi:FtsZ-interacting cell division protein ZipA
MDLLSVMALAVFVVAFAGIILLTLWFSRRADSPLARRAIVRERIRREVQEEFEQELGHSSGVRRWWLVLRREAEISRRAGRVIHGR